MLKIEHAAHCQSVLTIWPAVDTKVCYGMAIPQSHLEHVVDAGAIT